MTFQKGSKMSNGKSDVAKVASKPVIANVDKKPVIAEAIVPMEQRVEKMLNQVLLAWSSAPDHNRKLKAQRDQLACIMQTLTWIKTKGVALEAGLVARIESLKAE